jgi:hypothetical protein
MRLIHTSLATAALVAVTGTAFAATTTNSVSTNMGGTSRIAPGGQLDLITARRSGSKRFRVTIKYHVTIRSSTVLAFAVYPCKSTGCIGSSTSKITLAPGTRHVTFHGHVPVVKRSDGRACVYAQLRDQGPQGKKPGRIVRNGSHKGVSLCAKA